MNQLRISNEICMQLPLWEDAKAVILRYRLKIQRKRQVNVTLQNVLDHIRGASGYLSTQEVSDAMSTEARQIPERSVRAAVTWLTLSGHLVKSEKPIIRQANGQPYKVWLYKWTGKDDPIREIRQNAEEREVQKWDDSKGGGVLLQNIFMQMGRR